MTHKTNPLRFTPLNQESQGNTQSVLYYDSDASIDAIYETITSRFLAAYRLAEFLNQLKNPTPIALLAMTEALMLLLSDTSSLLQELNPVSLELRREEGK